MTLDQLVDLSLDVKYFIRYMKENRPILNVQNPVHFLYMDLPSILQGLINRYINENIRDIYYSRYTMPVKLIVIETEIKGGAEIDIYNDDRPEIRFFVNPNVKETLTKENVLAYIPRFFTDFVHEVRHLLDYLDKQDFTWDGEINDNYYLSSFEKQAYASSIAAELYMNDKDALDHVEILRFFKTKYFWKIKPYLSHTNYAALSLYLSKYPQANFHLLVEKIYNSLIENS